MNKINKDSQLFHDVQMIGLYDDSKTFADAIYLGNPDEIESLYHKEKVQPNFDLKQFVNSHFTIPNQIESKFRTNTANAATAHINELWEVLTRAPDSIQKDSLIPLPNAYVVPGGRFREIYYWDSYFTMLGLVVSERTDLIGSMLNNFQFLISTYGFIPNGNRSYFLSRSQPPFFALMVDLYQKNGKSNVQYNEALLIEHKFWMSNNRKVQHQGFLLNRYWDDCPEPRPESYREDVELAQAVDNKKNLFLNLRAACESGWDFSSRWLKDSSLTSIRTTEILPIDLNCLLYFLEKMINENELAAKRATAINELMWDPSEGYYFDFNFATDSKTDAKSLAGMFPLFMEIASSTQAERVAIYVKNHFLKPGGLVSTTLQTGQQWDSPNGWAPLQWIAVKGLLNYGHKTLALEIANRWIILNESVFNRTGKFVEKYNVCDLDLKAGGGEYPVQDGFGWSNGVYLALKALVNEV